MLEAALLQCLAFSRQARDQHGEALAATLDRLDAALKDAREAPRLAVPMLELDMDGYLTGWNHGAEQLFGYTRDEALGQHVLFLYADDDEDGKIAELFVDPASTSTSKSASTSASASTNVGMSMGGEVRRRKKSGDLCWVRLSLTPLLDAAGVQTGMAVRLSSSGEILSPQDKISLHARIIEESDQGVLITDAAERIISINSAFTRITGYTPAEAIGQTADLLRSGVHDAEFRSKVRSAMRGDGPWRGEIVGKRKNGELFPQSVTISVMRDDAGNVSHSFSLFSDISVHKDAEARMQRMANYDGLTGLPNRCLLNQLVDQALTEARRSQSHGALLVIDIGRVAAITDTLGHEAGDQLLIEIGRLFRMVLRDADVLARIESYKFVVALLDVEKREHAAIVAQKLLAALEAPIIIDAQSLQVSAHIGISVFPEDGLDTVSLLRFAEVAVAKAAQSIEVGFLFYREEMNQRAKEHLRLESELRLALGTDQLQLHYQPKVSLRSGRIVGAEALLRWKHPVRGMVSPAVFIPVAEETGLILELGSWVLEEACRQICAWRDDRVAMPTIAVNLSARQFDRHLPGRIAAVLEKYAVRPEQIMLEITESLLVRGADNVIAIMNELVAMGLALALDDFGTGYSSLAYLKKFPISTLKIDRSFVIGLPYEENDCAIARAIVTMAQQLRQEIVAEGVETAEQMSFLRELGCDQLQGYLFSPAVPAFEFERMLREGQRLAFGR